MKLDDRLGPALPISAEAQEKLIASALDQVYAKKQRPRWIVWAAAAALLIGAPAAIAAWMSARAPEKPIAPPPPPISPPPVVIEAPQPPPMIEPPPAEPKKPKKKKRSKREAEDLLAKANALRRESRWRDAERVYLEVVDRFEKSGSAYVALVAAASLRLEHLDDPKGALELLAKGRKKKGALDAEILWIQARAHRKLRQMKEEHEAIERLLRDHPESPFVDEAKERLR